MWVVVARSDLSGEWWLLRASLVSMPGDVGDVKDWTLKASVVLAGACVPGRVFC